MKKNNGSFVPFFLVMQNWVVENKIILFENLWANDSFRETTENVSDTYTQTRSTPDSNIMFSSLRWTHDYWLYVSFSFLWHWKIGILPTC